MKPTYCGIEEFCTLDVDSACPKIHTQTDFPGDYCNPRRLGLKMQECFHVSFTVSF